MGQILTEPLTTATLVKVISIVKVAIDASCLNLPTYPKIYTLAIRTYNSFLNITPSAFLICRLQ